MAATVDVQLACLARHLAEAILSGKLLPGDLALFDFGEDGWTLEPRRASEPAEAAAGG